MEQGLTYAFSVAGNFLLIGGLVVYGLRMMASYHERGKWAKNITGLLAGFGMLTLALALLITPRNTEVLNYISVTRASRLLLWVSNALLVAAIAGFGVITYARPFRLRREQDIGRELKRDLPKIP